MTYIINPWLFYWIDIVDAIKYASLILAILAGIAVFVSIVCWYDAYDDDMGKVAKRFVKIFGVVSIVLFVLFLVIPSQKTCIKMLIAKQITIENATWTVDSLKSMVDYIVDAVQGIK